MKNVFATIGFVTVVVGAYSLGEKKGYKKAVNDFYGKVSELTKNFSNGGVDSPCESNASEK